VRAAVLTQAGPDSEVDLRDDVTVLGPGPGEVRVALRATGVCHSDLSVLSGVLKSTLPVVPGHEGAGEIIEVGAGVTEVRPGQHVVISWTPACGACASCAGGQPFLCATYSGAGGARVPRFVLPDGTRAGGMAGCGTWAEEIVVPQAAVIGIDDDVPFAYAALLGCGIPTGVGAVVNTAGVRPGTTVAVVGCGGVGLAAIQGAAIAGAAVILAVDPLASKHAKALELGATHAATPQDAAAARAELTGGRGFDYAFEVVGRPAAIRSAWSLARRGGDVIVVGIGSRDDTVEFNAGELAGDAKRLMGSMYGGCDLRRDIPRFVALWRAGKLDIEALISARITFGELNQAVSALREGNVVRQIVTFG
jgi:S-(hydroxymethyl)glutathione dehydrogenase / alcohol dehydrogenase